MKYINSALWIAGSLTALASPMVQGSAFQIQEQSAALLGNAFSGSAVLGQDASTLFYNPAGLVNIENKQVSFSSTVISARTRMTTDISQGSFGDPIQGRNDNPNALLPVPGLYMADRLSSKVVFGLGVTAPFGLKTQYDRDSYVRYLSSKSELVVIDLTPNLAYQWNDQWAFGLGIDLMTIDATLNSRFDAEGDGIVAGDAFQKNSAKGRSISYHGGFLYKADPSFQLGFVYHAPIYIDVKGQSKSTIPGGTPRQDIDTRAVLPESMTLSTRYEWQPRWSLLADLGWTRWYRMQELRINFESGSSVINPLHFKSTWRGALGLNHQYTNSWLLRAGVSVEGSPVQESARTPRVPDSDRLWLALGARKQMSKHLKIDFGYSHIFFRKAFLDDRGSLSSLTNQPIFGQMRYKGNFRSQADLVGLQLSWDYV